MKKTVLLLLILSLPLISGFFNDEAKKEKEAQAQKARLCKVFTKKAIDYEKSMRDDELARITLESYKKRAHIYCTKEEVIKKEVAQKISKPKEELHKKNIALEDERLCRVFKKKLEDYKKTMRDDELAYTTLESYKKRAYIFCSKESLEKKEQSVRQEDKKLCHVFKQGPILCKKFDKKIQADSNETLAKVTLQSFQKRAKLFCSSKPLHEKDKKVYEEHKRLCKIFQDKIIAYQKDMREDKLAKATLESYKRRAKYFCATSLEDNATKE